MNYCLLFQLLPHIKHFTITSKFFFFLQRIFFYLKTKISFRFKVKLTPGTARRGKASKTALAIFMKDKTCSPREKDLLKGVKDEVLARNIPGKVKISAPQLARAYK